MHLKYTFETVELDNKIIAVPVGSDGSGFHGVIRLNETGAYILDLLKQETTEEAIITAMKNEYDTPEENIAKDVHAYLERFREKDILVES